MAKQKVELVVLASQGVDENGVKSKFRYYTKKNIVTTKERLTLRKYDPTLRKHVEFKETK
jgi:ribosomal protein L33